MNTRMRRRPFSAVTVNRCASMKIGTVSTAQIEYSTNDIVSSPEATSGLSSGPLGLINRPAALRAARNAQKPMIAASSPARSGTRLARNSCGASCTS